MATVQHGQQIPHGPQVQAPTQQYPQVPVKPVPGVFQVPPPPPAFPVRVPEVDETFIRVLGQMKYVSLEHFSGTMEPTIAQDWKHSLDKCLKTISFPPRLNLNIAELYLSGDASVWWDGVRSMHRGELTYEDFLHAFSKKYFLREALHQKKNDFKHLRRFLDGMRVELHGRCSVVFYTSLEDLVEKAAVHEKCMAEEQKFVKAAQPKTGWSSEAQQRTWDKPTPEALVAAAARNCFGCDQPGHIIRDCPRRGNAALPPPLKRLAIAPRLFAVGDARGAEPIADEAVATDLATIGVRTKLHAPPEVSSSTREKPRASAGNCIRHRCRRAPPSLRCRPPPFSAASVRRCTPPVSHRLFPPAGDPRRLLGLLRRVDSASQLGDSVNRLV
ncbi:hypothetical protein F2Q70_00003206 [Brassica cretica]|uniref:CCHC-type domain-containing protein n=1 Tax=Brassica cretica TaxID=69181 RepID=A0A8S9IVE3_BRACR|nr:hypothetical protein F2Q70_00003206 [Brassica cretica]